VAAQRGGLQVLLADDNFHMRAIVASILVGAGITKIIECADGAEALNALRNWNIDLALVDFNMSPVDGVEFTRTVRNAADSVNRYLPIIMLTGHSELTKVMEARDAGVNEFVVKPVTARAVLARINSIVNHPRAFVRTESYFGPDRRRKADRDYAGPFRRSTDLARESPEQADRPAAC
jgi:CheY-like chemotaxis protein